jgi:hypothetical protein
LLKSKDFIGLGLSTETWIADTQNPAHFVGLEAKSTRTLGSVKGDDIVQLLDHAIDAQPVNQVVGPGVHDHQPAPGFSVALHNIVVEGKPRECLVER